MVTGPVAEFRAALRRLPIVVLMVLATVLVTMAVVLLHRYQQELAGVGAVEAPTFRDLLAANEAFAAGVAPTGSFTAPITYSVLDGGDVSSQVSWDDGWFFADPAAYNHELARTMSVIATLAYAESNYYQASYDAPAYMENALVALGFQEVSTESYRYRSEVVDQVLNVFTQDEDAVAYTIARKTVADGEGAVRDLILVSVRGSYGSEWLSNLDFYVGAGDGQVSASDVGAGMMTQMASAAEGIGAADSDAVSAGGASGEGGDHPGYTVAAQEVCEALVPWIERSHAAGHEVSLVLTGHSRGGAVANLAASMLIDAQTAPAGADADCSVSAQDEVASGASASSAGAFSSVPAAAAADVPSQTDTVSAYTFAAPRVTVSADAHGDAYAGIFNIVHPADPMPSLPLEAWGYDRYGVDVVLPAADDADFAGRYERMRAAFEQVMGREPTFDPEQVYAIRTMVSQVRALVPTAEDFFSPNGVTTVLGALAINVNPAKVLEGHYPSVYIAWMQALSADEVVLAG